MSKDSYSSSYSGKNISDRVISLESLVLESGIAQEVRDLILVFTSIGQDLKTATKNALQVICPDVFFELDGSLNDSTREDQQMLFSTISSLKIGPTPGKDRTKCMEEVIHLSSLLPNIKIQLQFNDQTFDISEQSCCLKEK